MTGLHRQPPADVAGSQQEESNTTWEYTIPSIEACAASRNDELPMDREAFAGFYQRSAPALRAYLVRVSGNSALADDLLQESYLRFLCAKQPEGGEVNFRRYLFRIATNLLRDHWRKPRHGCLDASTRFPTSFWWRKTYLCRSICKQRSVRRWRECVREIASFSGSPMPKDILIRKSQRSPD